MNTVVLRGTLSRDPDHRVLPSGTTLVALDVTTRVEGERAASVPVAWFDPPARSARLAAGEEVVVVGQVRRRFFRSAVGTQSRTEVVASRILGARSAKASTTARAALERAIEAVGA